MSQFGVWSSVDGGRVGSSGYLTKEEAEQELADLIADDDMDPDETYVVEICPDHDEQARDACEECATDEEECCETCDVPVDDGCDCDEEDA